MKALSVRQPWAYAIAAGLKPIENRTWTTKHRGLLAIHAATRWDSDGARRVAELTGQVVVKTAMAAVVAVVDLVGCHGSQACMRTTRHAHSHPDGPYECSPWAVGVGGEDRMIHGGMHHWELANPRQLAEPVPCKGRLGLWDLPEDVESAVVAQLAVAVDQPGEAATR